MVRVTARTWWGAAVRRLARSDAGQAVVEFALVAPIFLLLLFGMIEFARAFNAYLVITNVAREAARTAVLDDNAITSDSVRSLISSGLHSASLDRDAAVVELTGVDGPAGTPARVVIRYPFQLTMLGRFGGSLPSGGGITLATAVVMRNE